MARVKNRLQEAMNMDKWQCLACPYIYDPALGDPDGGVPAGTKFEDIPDDWMCPICGVAKTQFKRITT